MYDVDFFNYHFLHRAIQYAKAVIVLSEEGLDHEAVVLCRCLLEGHVYHMGFQEDSNFAINWRLYALYEDFLLCKFLKTEEELKELIEDYKNKFGSEKIEECLSLFDIDKKEQNWSPLHRNDIIKKNEKELRDFRNFVYADLSSIIHWTPRGIVSGSESLRSGLVVAIQCILSLSININNAYELAFEEELQEFCDKFLQAHKK